MSSALSPAASLRRRPHPISSESIARSRLPLSVETSGSRSIASACSLSEPVPGADTLPASAFDLGDAGGDVGIEETVVCSFGGKAAQGTQIDVDGGRSQAALFQGCAIGLEKG